MNDPHERCNAFTDDLLWLALDDLPAARRDEVRAHLDECASCRAKCDDVLIDLEVLRGLGPEKAPIDLHDALRKVREENGEQERSTPHAYGRRFPAAFLTTAAVFSAGVLLGWLAREVTNPGITPSDPLDSANREFAPPEALYRWVERLPPDPKPAARQGALGVWQPGERRLILVGGYSGVADEPHYSDTWIFTHLIDQWQRRGDGPLPLAGAVGVWDTHNGRALVFGGALPFGEPNNELFGYDPDADAWTELASDGPRPPGGDGGSTAWDPVAGCMYVFGTQPGGVETNELWRYCVGPGGWEQLDPGGDQPSPRAGHTSVWDTRRGELVAYGGRSAGSITSDVFIYNPTDDAWRRAPQRLRWPVSRQGHAATWNERTGTMIIAGGADGELIYDDVWEFEPASGTWIPLRLLNFGPMPRTDLKLYWDGAENFLHTFGGLDSLRQRHNDVWLFEQAR